MSRYCGETNPGILLEAAEHWRLNGLIADGSIFTEKSLWKIENFEALERYFIKQPDEGEGTFFDKLAAQLEETATEVKQLTAEILWVMFLCPSNIGAAKKKEGIQIIWSWSEEPFPEDSPWLKDDVLKGIGSSGTAYNTNRWRELAFVIRVMIALKKLRRSDREALLGDGWAFASWMEEIPECDSRQFRHMTLFLLFPDEFERIFGGVDRRKIVVAFSGKTKAKVNKLSALEVDKELLTIRQEQEQSYDTTELDFYRPPLKDIWSETKSATWLLSWNPNNWHWESLKEDRRATHQGRTVTLSASMANRNAAIGDKVYLARTGVEPRGIVATGNIVSDPYEDTHWDESKASEGKTCWFVDVSYTRIQDPLEKDPYLPSEDLKTIKIDQQEWFPRSSGIEIKQRSAGILKKRWETVVESTIESISNDIKTDIAEGTNRIYYGPPGTGKTYQLNKLLERYSKNQQEIGREPWLMQQLSDVRWFDAVFAALYDLGTKATAKDIVNHEFIRLKAQVLGRYRNVGTTVKNTLRDHSSVESQYVRSKDKRGPFVFDKGNDNVWSLTGDWEEECAEQVAHAKALKNGPQEGALHRRYEFVTFHQAYSYEDFVEGIRPVADDETGNLVYNVVAGVFHRIAMKAKADPGHRYAIFIDEINRGNIAKIFGELITLIEPDKRAVYSDDGRKLSGMELTLPYSGKPFGVPRNLDLYGTMNTADRSIALLDTALRRRFEFKELMPNEGFINGTSGDGEIDDGQGGTINLRAFLKAMNKRIIFLRNRDLTLGHAYFMDIRDFDGLKKVLLDQIIPLLQEYFYDDWHCIQLVFGDVGPFGQKLEPQIICHETLKEQDVLGFDHDDYEDVPVYWVAKSDDITPDSIRKVYEETS